MQYAPIKVPVTFHLQILMNVKPKTFLFNLRYPATLPAIPLFKSIPSFGLQGPVVVCRVPILTFVVSYLPFIAEQGSNPKHSPQKAKPLPKFKPTAQVILRAPIQSQGSNYCWIWVQSHKSKSPAWPYLRYDFQILPRFGLTRECLGVQNPAPL